MYGLSVKILNKNLYNQTYDNIEIIQLSIDEKMKEYDEIINSFQDNQIIIEALSDEKKSERIRSTMYETIYAALNEQKIKPIVHMINLSGEKVFSTLAFPETYRVSLANNWGIFRTMSESEEQTVIYPQQITYLLGKKSIISMGSKIFNNEGFLIGYVIIDIPRDVILQELNKINSGVSLHLVMVDDNDYTLLDTQNPTMEGKLQRSSYMDSEKIQEYKSIKGEIIKDSFLQVNYTDELLKTTTIVNVSSHIFQSINNIMKIILLIGVIVSLIITSVISFIMASYVSNPIKELITIMGKVEEGSFNVRATSRSNDEIGDLGKYFNQMLQNLNTYMNKVIEKQQQLRITEIKMLQAQINPHFIYNTLDVIKWSAKLNQNKATVSVVTNLAKLLRFSIDCDEEFVSVQRSIDFINSYLAIQQIKFNNTFKVLINIDSDMLEYMIPRLILQPFIENAIVHGLRSNEDNSGIITIKGHVSDSVIEFQIIDNGEGMTGEQIQEIAINTSDLHIGIHNVDQRIKMYYGDLFGVKIESEKNKGTKVMIILPVSINGGAI